MRVADDEAWQAAIANALEAYPHAGSAAALKERVGEAIAAGAQPEHARDVVLASAVSRGDPAAVSAFDRDVADEIAIAARRIDRSPAFVDEVCQAVRVRLVVADGNAPPRIATYRGRGPLRAWVAVAALRFALGSKRAARPQPPDDVLADVVDREPDPELRHLKALYRAEFRDTLGGALAALPDRERALLRLRFVDGFELLQIGKLYGMCRARMSRTSATCPRTATRSRWPSSKTKAASRPRTSFRARGRPAASPRDRSSARDRAVGPARGNADHRRRWPADRGVIDGERRSSAGRDGREHSRCALDR